MGTAAGPERLTLTERVVGATGLPYAEGCILIGLLAGAPGYFVLLLLENGSVAKAYDLLLSNPFFSITEFGSALPVGQGIAEASVWTIFLILTLYFTRYIRTTVLKAEPALVGLVAEGMGEERYHRAFGGMDSVWNALPLVAAFVALYLPSRVTAGGGSSLWTSVVILPVDFLIICVALWMYLRALWGVYSFGKEKLNLKRFYEDSVLGLRPLGSISLSFTIVFLLLVGTALVGSLISSDLSNLLVQTGLLCLLATMIFLPLQGVHRKMVDAKARDEAALKQKIMEIAEEEDKGVRSGDNTKALLEVNSLLTYRLLKEQAAKTPTWPFDTGNLERVIALLLSIAGIIVARLIQVALHF